LEIKRLEIITGGCIELYTLHEFRYRLKMWEYELNLAARKLVEYVCGVRKGEDVLILGDTANDTEVLNATAAATYAAGATPTVVITETRKFNNMEPPRPVAAAMLNADVEIEFTVKALLYTRAQVNAEKQERVYICLTELDKGAFVRTIGWVDYPKMVEFGEKLAELTSNADVLRVTSPSGTDFTGEIGGRKWEDLGGTAATRKVLVLGGQTGGSCIEETMNGTLAFDANVWPPDEIRSKIFTPIKFKVERGIIKEISGGTEAEVMKKYLAGFSDPNMYRIAHLCFGYHPNAIPSGGIAEAERFWGCFQVGWGSQGPLIRPDLKGDFGWKAASHDDGIIAKASVYLDGKLVQRDGKFVHPELLKIIKEWGIEQ